MGYIRAGRLDRLVSIERRGPPVHDGYARVPGAWAPLAQRWASIKPVRGRETQEGQGRSGTAQITFWMRFDSVTSTLTERDSLVWNGQRYDIVAPPLEIGRREGIEVFASAGELDNASEPVT